MKKISKDKISETPLSGEVKQELTAEVKAEPKAKADPRIAGIEHVIEIMGTLDRFIVCNPTEFKNWLTNYIKRL